MQFLYANAVSSRSIEVAWEKQDTENTNAYVVYVQGTRLNQIKYR